LGFQYDRYGNRTQQNLLAGTGFAPQTPTDPTTNHLLSPNVYDASGNMTNDTFHTYAYDAQNRAKTVDTTGATYTYVGALRVKKVVGSTTTVYVFSGNKVMAEYVNGAPVNQPTKEYVYAGSRLLATVAAGGATTYQHPDHLSIRAETDALGNLTRSFGHYPFGEAWYETGTASKWKFTSYERDSESALDQAVFRYYSSRLGRFMSPDWLAGYLGDPQSLDRYAYVRNDPVNYVDRLGLGYCVWYDDVNGNTYDFHPDSAEECQSNGGTYVSTDTTIVVNGDDSGDSGWGPRPPDNGGSSTGGDSTSSSADSSSVKQNFLNLDICIKNNAKNYSIGGLLDLAANGNFPLSGFLDNTVTSTALVATGQADLFDAASTSGRVGYNASRTLNPAIMTNGPNSLTTISPVRGSPQPVLGSGTNYNLSFLGKVAKVLGAAKGIADVSLAGALVADCLAGKIQ
jgi:RHS repeat-associated protein